MGIEIVIIFAAVGFTFAGMIALIVYSLFFQRPPWEWMGKRHLLKELCSGERTGWDLREIFGTHTDSLLPHIVENGLATRRSAPEEDSAPLVVKTIDQRKAEDFDATYFITEAGREYASSP